MADMNDRVMAVFSIITRGKAKSYMQELDGHGIGFNIQMTAHGTAPSEMMDIFGLGTNDKDIVLSLAPETLVDSYAYELSRSIGGSFEYGGLMMCIRLSAISRLTSELVMRRSNDNTEAGGRTKVKNMQKHQLIVVSVNQGYTDAVMETAKRAGAMGGTVLRARLADSDAISSLGDLDVQQEREVLTIFAPASTAATIMNEINREHGVTSHANGMVFALPVDKAYKI